MRARERGKEQQRESKGDNREGERGAKINRNRQTEIEIEIDGHRGRGKDRRM